MSVSFDPNDELRTSVPFPEIPGGTTFVSGTGRIYRLFGNEEGTFSLPEVPAIPPCFAAAKKSTLSLEEALQQIESYSSLTVSEKVVQPKTDPPILQLFPLDPSSNQPLGGCSETSKETQVVKRGHEPLSNFHVSSMLPQHNTTFSVKDIVDEVSQHLPCPHEEKRKPLRVIFEYAEEPFIVPFTKAESLPEVVETRKNRTFKVITEVAPPVLFPKIVPKYWQFRRTENTPYRKQCFLPSLADSHTEEPAVIDEPKPGFDVSMFQWSAQLNSLMQSANNQTRMLTDHLVVQSNQGVKTVCFKSVFPGDGCSTILLCAVRALTERKYRVLLVDAHHRHINLPKQLNLAGNLDSGNTAVTLNEYLGLWVWQESKTAEENTALLGDLLTAHREEYDLIMLDCGSLTESPLTEFVEFWNRIKPDGIILVSNMKHPPEISMSHVAERLRQHQIHLIGITENYV